MSLVSLCNTHIFEDAFLSSYINGLPDDYISQLGYSLDLAIYQF